MKNFWLIIIVFTFMLSGCSNHSPEATQTDTLEKPQWAIVVHGGAGNMNPDNFTTEQEKTYKDKLSEALAAGGKILANKGSAADAVEAAIRILEDSPLFNAGKGAVFNADGINELDASFMDGQSLNAGAVANVRRIKNPISAARQVMEQSPHVMLIREGAENFAESQGLEMVKPEYFFTESRWQALQRVKEREKQNIDDKPEKRGTVGCVALDMQGNLAAGTSTGGMTNKKYGRVGDSPIIGSGTYADNSCCGVSATGHGEFFIRNVVAYDIVARVKYKGETCEEAAKDIINKKLKALGADGGVIVLDKDGKIAMPFNTTGMFRGFLYPNQKAQVYIFDK